jgi:hypothetical protein
MHDSRGWRLECKGSISMVDAVATARTRFPSFEILGKSQSSSLQCNATTRFRPQRRHLIFLRVHLLAINISYSGTMTDRAAKRLRRLSTEYDNSEENTEWNNSRYVADIPSRLVTPSFIAPRARGETQGGCGFEQTISCRGSRNRPMP